MAASLCASSSSGASVVVALLLLFIAAEANYKDLTPKYYDRTCPGAAAIIRRGVNNALSNDRTLAAALIRLHFHDCFVDGCEASILLDSTSEINGEKEAPPNLSVRGYEVIDSIKAEIENACPGVYSCADLLTVAAKDATEYVGGPSWRVSLGRRDSKTASRDRATNDIPRFSSSLSTLVDSFASNGLNERDLVALSGAHTIGVAACSSYRDRIYGNSSSLYSDERFVGNLRNGCPPASSSTSSSNNGYYDNNNNNNNRVVLDPSPFNFDNRYFKNLVRGRGLLTSDQVLYNEGTTDRIVEEYSKNQDAFFKDFAAAMVKMANIHPLTGSTGQVRRNCRVVNN